MKEKLLFVPGITKCPECGHQLTVKCEFHKDTRIVGLPMALLQCPNCKNVEISPLTITTEEVKHDQK